MTYSQGALLFVAAVCAFMLAVGLITGRMPIPGSVAISADREEQPILFWVHAAFLVAMIVLGVSAFL